MTMERRLAAMLAARVGAGRGQGAAQDDDDEL